jgi:hypothetical protein
MKWLNCAKIRFVLVGFVVSIVISGDVSTYADFTFSTPVEVEPPIWYSGYDPQGCCFSRDGLELYFSTRGRGSNGSFDIWVATRESVDAPWGEPVNLGSKVNSPAGKPELTISHDGLELYFTLYGESPYIIQVFSRPSKDAPWSKPEPLGPSVGVYTAYCAEVSADGLSLYLGSSRTDGYGSADIWVSNRDATSDPWPEPVNLGPIVNTAYNDGYPSISSDGLALFFCSDRPGGLGSGDIWVTTRPTTDAEWGPPINYPSLNQSRDDWGPAISADGSVLYFESAFNMWQSSITPIVDLNGDGIVDNADMCIMVDHWGEDYSLCDIGPMPWGDDIVDVEDMKVLAEHLFTYPGAVAYWTLDEEQGIIAYDSVADCDGTLIGDPLWQPDAGMVAGALQFDGIDDYIITDSVLIPADGPFSVFAWIKGGAPGQAILSQTGAANWLFIDSVEGCLMTELRIPGRFGKVLMSQTCITDENWHRIALVWDGSYRHLYVDGIEIASDDEPLSGLIEPFGGLCIGTGINCADSTFFSGLIDDVRIYNRAIHP